MSHRFLARTSSALVSAAGAPGPAQMRRAQCARLPLAQPRSPPPGQAAQTTLSLRGPRLEAARKQTHVGSGGGATRSHNTATIGGSGGSGVVILAYDI